MATSTDYYYSSILLPKLSKFLRHLESCLMKIQKIIDEMGIREKKSRKEYISRFDTYTSYYYERVYTIVTMTIDELIKFAQFTNELMNLVFEFK